MEGERKIIIQQYNEEEINRMECRCSQQKSALNGPKMSPPPSEETLMMVGNLVKLAGYVIVGSTLNGRHKSHHMQKSFSIIDSSINI